MSTAELFKNYFLVQNSALNFCSIALQLILVFLDHNGLPNIEYSFKFRIRKNYIDMCWTSWTQSFFVLLCTVYLHKNKIFFCPYRLFMYSRGWHLLDTLIWCFNVSILFPALIERMTWMKNKQEELMNPRGPMILFSCKYLHW